MKHLLLVFVLMLSTALPSQVDTTFSELRGMNDAAGVTHLFYRKYSFYSFPPYWTEHNDVYHLNLTTQSDSLIFEDYFNNTYINFGGPAINDFEFWNNDPAKYAYCGTYTEVDPGAYIWHYLAGVVWESLGEVFTIEISHQGDSLLYSCHYGLLLKSTDGGYNWDYDPNAASYFELISVSPFDDQILFATKEEDLYKSTDGGISYTLADSSVAWLDWGRSQLFFDADSLYFFGITKGYYNHLLRSTDAGDSWTLLLSGTDRIALSLDPSHSGAVFLSDGNEIKMSNDYGTTFTPYWQFPRPVVGLYKKPDSDIIYAATTKNIYEVTPTDTVSIKHLFSIPVSIDDNVNPVTKKFELHQNYPNPFNPTTTIRFDLPKASHVQIELFNIAGQKVATIFEGRKTAGSHTAEFDGSDLPSGVYFYRLTANGFTDVKKMILMR